jgi:transcriptional regulator with XRE-family HTH domain
LVPSKPSYRRIVGEQIRTYRKRAGLTQEKLAEKADLHHNFIGEVERGNQDISVGSLVKIASALGIKVRDLIGNL